MEFMVQFVYLLSSSLQCFRACGCDFVDSALASLDSSE